MEGRIFNIQRFSIQDGPGIRTNVFFKGCSLRCAWCHNPEGLSPRAELSFLAEKCIQCRACQRVCPQGAHQLDGETHRIVREQCTACGSCAEICPNGALEILGKSWTVDAVVRAVLRDKPFYLDGGGATLTGGEPLLQSEFATAVAQALTEEGISVCLETSGFAPVSAVESIAPYLDYALFDIKETDEERHRQFTGVGMAEIHANLRRLNDLGVKIILRCPIIPGVNARPEHYEAIAALACSLEQVQAVHLEPYHPLGIGKAQRVGREMAYQETDFLEAKTLEQPAAFLLETTGKQVTIL